MLLDCQPAWEKFPLRSPDQRQCKMRYSWFMAACLLVGSVFPAVAETSLLEGTNSLSAYAWSPLPRTQDSLWSAPAKDIDETGQWITLERPATGFLVRLAQNTPPGEQSLCVWSVRRHSRYTEGSRTSVSTGYGQFFAGDTAGRSRTSGAGLEDPSWVFLKMSFLF